MEQITSKKGEGGLIIGKFMPPHLGHKYLVDFARNYATDLTVLVCSIKKEPIPGKLRYQWMKQIFPDINIIHVTDENPQEPADHPDFWNIWKKTIKKRLPKNTKYLFASEDYGWQLAKILGLKYIPVNHGRELVPVSGTKIRKNPIENWKYIPSQVRPYFVKKVCIFGPESTGKSTLTKQLADHYQTTYVHEYARDLLNFKDGKCDYSDISLIAKGHAAAEKALAHQANRVLFSDTDIITTTMWSEVLFKKCPAWIKKAASKSNYDLYLLTDIDTPWVKDNQRYLPNKRRWFRNWCIKELQKRNCNYVIINGNWDERLQKATKAVDKLLKS